MPGFRLRTILAALVLSCAPLLSALAADPPKIDDAERARIEQAVAEKIQADRDKAQSDAIAKKSTALLHDSHTQALGNPDGDVTVIEFFDYQCPFCKAAQPRLEKLVADDKKVKFIVKEFPILSAESLVASKAALASVKQGKYEAYHTAMMDHKGRLEMDHIWEIAKSVGLDIDRLKRDMDSPEIADEIIANMNLARSIKIVETPGFIVEGKVLTGPSAQMDFPKEVAAARAAKS